MITTFKADFETTLNLAQKIIVAHGETFEMNATLLDNGVPVDLEGYALELLYQDVDVLSAYYSIPASIEGTSTAKVVWGANNDIGARAYRCHLRAMKNGEISYPARWEIGMYNTPDFTASHLDPHVPVIDFDRYELLNAPWTLLSDFNNHVGNLSIHVTQDEKNTWNAKIDQTTLSSTLSDYATEDWVEAKISAIPVPDYPVTSVNGKTGVVVLSASDVDAIPTSKESTFEPSHKLTYLWFSDGTSESYDWSGELNQQKMIDAGLWNGNSWTKTIVKAEIGTDVTSIGSSAFANCTDLASMTIPNSVTSIGDYAFYHCRILTSVTIPASVTSIGQYAFYYCTSLTSVTIGNGVTSIGEMAFQDCPSLTTFIFEGKTLATVQGMENYSWDVDPSIISTWNDASQEWVNEQGFLTEHQALSDFVPKTTTVNNKALSGNITLDASDVGALPDSYTAPVASVNSKTGTVVLSASDVGAAPAGDYATVAATNAIANSLEGTQDEMALFDGELAVDDSTVIRDTYGVFHRFDPAVNNGVSFDTLSAAFPNEVSDVREIAFGRNCHNIGIMPNYVRDPTATNWGTIIEDDYLTELNTFMRQHFHWCSRIIVPNTCSTFAMYFNSDVGTSVKELVLPNSVGTIGLYGFHGLTFATKISWSGAISMVNFGSHAIDGLTRLELLDLSQITSIQPTKYQRRVGNRLQTVVVPVTAENVNPNLKIVVPDAEYTRMIASSTWAAWHPYLVKASDWEYVHHSELSAYAISADVSNALSALETNLNYAIDDATVLNDVYDASDNLEGYILGHNSQKLLQPAIPDLSAIRNVVDLVNFRDCYPDGSVTSEDQTTSGINYVFDASNGALVCPFTTVANTYQPNSHLSGTVIIPPFVDYDGTRYAVTRILDGGTGGEPNTNLKEVEAPNTIKSVVDYAFYYCTSLERIALPGATSIGYGTFISCTSLDEVNFGPTPRATVPTLDNHAFDGVPTTCKFIIPDEQYDAWTQANRWSTLVSQGYQFIPYSSTVAKTTSETWTFVLEDGTTVTKNIAVY